MFKVAKDWNPKQARLREIILKPDHFDEAIALCLDLHSIVHSSDVSPGVAETLFDEVWADLSKEAFEVVARNIWHITRIEDMTANVLILDAEQVLNDAWLKRLGVTVTDTANAWTDDKTISFSRSVNMGELRNYRNAVGVKTREIINSLLPADMKRKVKQESVKRILAEGGVNNHSTWLLDFWGRKNVAGILLMPITRHQVAHLNDSINKKMSRK